jgi:hypothetical protein
MGSNSSLVELLEGGGAGAGSLDMWLHWSSSGTGGRCCVKGFWLKDV